MAIKINISSLKDGSQQLNLVSDTKEIGLEESFSSGPIDIDLELTKTIHQLDIKAKIHGKLNVECDRCLEDFPMPLETGFEVVFVMRQKREEVINEDYIRTYEPHMRQVDITNDLKEMILLAVPMKKVPEEKPDGSCSWCGKGKDYWEGIIVEKEED
jgi:uncharacterized protein